MKSFAQRLRRERFVDESRRYLAANEPTPQLLHALTQSFADMVSAEHGQRVAVTIGSVSITRDAEPMRKS